jgi:hypothetical protein
VKVCAHVRERCKGKLCPLHREVTRKVREEMDAEDARARHAMGGHYRDEPEESADADA